MTITVAGDPAKANGAGPHVPADGGGDPGGDADPAAPDIAKLVAETVTKALDGYTTKINGEQAKLRKQYEALVKSTTPAPEPKPTEAPQAVDHEAMMGLVEQIAEIRAALPIETRDDLKADTEGLSYAEKLRLYQVAQKAHDRAMATAKATTEAGGETPAPNRGQAPKTSRAAVSATRESAQHPKTVAELLKIAKTDPKRKAQLDADDTFDPSSLPQF